MKRLTNKARARLANKLHDRAFSLFHDILRVTGDDGSLIPTLDWRDAGYVEALRKARECLTAAAELAGYRLDPCGNIVQPDDPDYRDTMSDWEKREEDEYRGLRSRR